MKIAKKKTEKNLAAQNKQVQEVKQVKPSPADDPDFEIDLSDDYEDDDFDLPFNGDKKELLEYLKRLEDDNLFKIQLMQDEEESLKQQIEAADYQIKLQSDEIEKVGNSISELVKKTSNAKLRNQYLAGVLSLQDHADADQKPRQQHVSIEVEKEGEEQEQEEKKEEIVIKRRTIE